MCYLGVLPRRSAMLLSDLENAFDHNSDGYGIMYAKGGRVVSWKHKGNFEAFAAKWDEMPTDRQIIVHFRFGTSGPTNADACHPFMVLNKEQHGMDLYLMHNGVLDYRVFAGSKKASDTMQYVNKLREMLQGNPSLIRNSAFRQVLERDLGNPNKMVLLEGSGRLHYLNKSQGTERDGVWHSNTYSLARVWSGHGRGKAANSVKYTTDDWDDHGYGMYGHSSVTRNDAGHVIQSATTAMDAAFRRTIGAAPANSDLTWALQIIRANGKEDEQVYWKKGLSGWLRMGRNASTGGFYRAFKQDGEALGADLVTILPANTIRFRPKNEAAWERGDRHTWTMEKGEHVPVPIVEGNASTATATLLLAKPSSAAGAVQQTMLLDEKDVARVANECGVRVNSLCRETNEPCQAGCVDQCTGAAMGQSASTFPQSGNATGHASLVARMATLEEQDEAEDDEDDDDYVEQLFSDANLRTMSEKDMWEAVSDYPDAAAVAMGRLLNLRWAFESEVA